MAVPKKKTSKMKTRSRRSQWKLEAPNVILDKKSGVYRLPHRVCASTGHYKSKQVLIVDEV
ncbi:MAG: 50S ribosomal protein L32 [Bradymonadales bacterium]|nr:MAG: 50S ribosomal protein L32 [Bradymonadales bacterium]